MPPSKPPSPPAPRRREVPLWPILAAGGSGLAVLAALAGLGRLDGLSAAAALVLVALVTAVATLAADRGSEAEPPPGEADVSVERAGVRYAELIEDFPDPILVVSGRKGEETARRRVVFANRAARELFRAEAAEGPLVGLLRDPQVLEACERALADDPQADAVYETTGERTFRVQARPLGEGEGGGRLALLAFRDETEARRVERTRADFLANASHELRTPLAALSGFIETLRGHARDDPAARERFLSIMQAQAERMGRLVDDLMSLSRIELNEHIPPREMTDLAAAVAEVADGLSPLAAERAVTLEVKLPPPGAAEVVGDRDQIQQVAQNLIDNALKYSPSGGVVTVQVLGGLAGEAPPGPGGPGQRLTLLEPDAAARSYAALQVTDRGAGIARESLPRLTERFYRVEGQKSGERSGTGLGLAIVKHIVNRHRGGLAVESAPGQGSTFTAYFPQVPPAA